ncbi:fasciclin domain-containing protein [Pedobacter sp. SAFR-022]|uniref:fasciclin domain-containing protein n=1 Tax=Pedobacter sp. SAFR-022 TaxID=3436861 RepID=UPI003F7E7C05
MKTISALKKTAMVFALAVISIATSCKKDDDEMPVISDQNIVEIVVGDNDFSLLEAAVKHADLVATLSGNGPFTVFAPTNEAFAAVGLDTEAKINALPKETLKKILLYHVASASIPASTIPATANTAVKSAADLDLYVTKTDRGVFINGATVTQADIMATNGIIHVINKVLMPPSGNIVEVAQGNPNFSFLVAAVLRASQGPTNVANVLSGDGPFTVFAPTNQAFMDAGFANVAAIQAADPAALTSILTYHVVAGRVFSTDLVDNSSPATVNGANVTITLNGGAKVKGAKNASAATISPADLVTTNGVIHVIDQVLLP